MARAQRLRRALEVARVARRSRLTRVVREIGVVGERPATREGAEEFLQLEALADELQVHLRGELDLKEEAHNTEVVGRAIEDFPELLARPSAHVRMGRDRRLRARRGSRRLHGLEDH